MTARSADRLVCRVWAELSRDPSELDALDALPDAPLPARLDVSGLAVGSVAAASLAATSAAASRTASGRGRVRLDGDRIAAAFTSDRAFLWNGERPDVWAPFSGFWRASDAWVRTHGNYPHHARALRRVLGVDDGAGRDEVAAAIGRRSADELAAAVTSAGGLCVVVRPESPQRDAALVERPLVEVTSVGAASGRRRPRSTDAAAAPLAGVRVLDLTRVIAGPVATRTLALLGADVLRVDPPEPPELDWQHLETGAGKRSTILDVRRAGDAATFDLLLERADVVVLGYRPTSLARHALDPWSLVARHPGLVIAQLSAWGFDGDDADRAGFDSLVQAASGIALVEGEPHRPGALPAQALDHATGYLLATAVITLLERRASHGGSSLARMSLRRTAAELLAMPRTPDPQPAAALDEAGVLAQAEHVVGPAGDLRLVRPAVVLGSPLEHWPAAPHPWGSDRPEWAS
ncbi:CoA transferase [Agromyces bauzanensis]